MPREEAPPAPRRREVLRMIGLAAGGAAMYQAMTALGLAHGARAGGEPQLGAAPRGASVLILGAGLAGMTAAYELRRAGYAVGYRYVRGDASAGARAICRPGRGSSRPWRALRRAARRLPPGI